MPGCAGARLPPRHCRFLGISPARGWSASSINTPRTIGPGRLRGGGSHLLVNADMSRVAERLPLSPGRLPTSRAARGRGRDTVSRAVRPRRASAHGPVGDRGDVDRLHADVGPCRGEAVLKRVHARLPASRGVSSARRPTPEQRRRLGPRGDASIVSCRSGGPAVVVSTSASRVQHESVAATSSAPRADRRRDGPRDDAGRSPLPPPAFLD